MQEFILNFLTIANLVLCALFFICYAYQMFFLFVSYIKKSKTFPDAPPHRLAILIAARNEERVIGNLLTSLREQNYPAEFFDVFVTADNCTDNTAGVARSYGAVVYERFNKEQIGKGYVLDLMLKNIWKERGEDAYDAFVVFDADNQVDPNFLSEINKTFSAGYEVVSSYRNTTNYGDGWRAAGVGMYFLRDARLLNNARMIFGTNTFIAGTGFLFSSKVALDQGGWPYHTLTEDFEFTVNNAFRGVKTGYCGTARFYDWQSTDFRQSWRQKLRWTKGGFQVMAKYGRKLFLGFFSRKLFSCLDMTVCIFAAFLVSLLAIIINLLCYIAYITVGGNPLFVIAQACLMLSAAYSVLLFFSVPMTISEWKYLRGSTFKKILYCFTFPIYILTFIPVSFVALFSKNVEWKPINHGDASNLGEKKKEDKENRKNKE